MRGLVRSGGRITTTAYLAKAGEGAAGRDITVKG
jgi:hypothetical protein